MLIRTRGMPRTGNNFTIALLRLNTAGIFVKADANHDLMDMEKWERSPDPIVVVIKNPYSWFLSISLYGLNRTRSEEYAKANRDTNWHLWRKMYMNFNGFYEGYFELFEKHGVSCVLVRYEDLLKDPRKELYAISNKFNTNLTDGEIYIPKRVISSEVFTEERKEFYLGEGDFGLKPEWISKINEVVDWDLMNHYGYSQITP